MEHEEPDDHPEASKPHSLVLDQWYNREKMMRFMNPEASNEEAKRRHEIPRST